MKRTIAKYGLIAGLFLAVTFGMSVPLSGTPPDYGLMEVFGYASMILASLIIVLAQREYRSHNRDGSTGFGAFMKVGLGVAAIMGLVLGLYTFAHIAWLEPDFGQKYMAYSLDQMRTSGATAAAVASQRAEMEAMMSAMNSPSLQGIIMFGTTFVMGAVVTAIGGFVMGRRRAIATPNM